MSFMLMFDLPRELILERKHVNLALHRINAKMIQFSVWEHENLSDLMRIALTIKQHGGSAKY